MAENPVRIEPDSGSLDYIDVGYTDGDAAGQVYLSTNKGDIAFFTPSHAGDLRAAVVAAKKQADEDAALQKVTIRIPDGATDAEIVDAVKAAMEK